jgi:hypothetical protein
VIYLTLLAFAAALDMVVVFGPATIDPILVFDAAFNPSVVFGATLN